MKKLIKELNQFQSQQIEPQLLSSIKGGTGDATDDIIVIDLISD